MVDYGEFDKPEEAKVEVTPDHIKEALALYEVFKQEVKPTIPYAETYALALEMVKEKAFPLTTALESAICESSGQQDCIMSERVRVYFEIAPANDVYRVTTRSHSYTHGNAGVFLSAIHNCSPTESFTITRDASVAGYNLSKGKILVVPAGIYCQHLGRGAEGVFINNGIAQLSTDNEGLLINHGQIMFHLPGRELTTINHCYIDMAYKKNRIVTERKENKITRTLYQITEEVTTAEAYKANEEEINALLEKLRRPR